MSKVQDLRHGGDEAVLDESRGICSTPVAGMRRHAASCARCRENLSVWKSFAGVADRLREAEPPVEVVDRARALAGPLSRVTRRTRLNARLEYDSVWVPLAAGVRGASPGQTVHQAGGFAIELRVSRERTNVVIVGQVTNLRRPTQRFANLRVELGAGDRVVVRTASNGLGEFHLEHPERDRMWIEVVPEEDHLIRIPLRPGQTS
jgi:hypothetical protein